MQLRWRAAQHRDLHDPGVPLIGTRRRPRGARLVPGTSGRTLDLSAPVESLWPADGTTGVSELPVYGAGLLAGTPSVMEFAHPRVGEDVRLCAVPATAWFWAPALSPHTGTVVVPEPRLVLHVDDPSSARQVNVVNVTRRETIRALRRALGESAAVAAWDWACAEVGVDGDAQQYSHQELLAIAQKLASSRGLIGVVGNSLLINLSTSEALSQDAAASEAPTSDATLLPAEKERLQEIADLGLVSRDVDAILTGLTEQAAQALGLPVAMVSIVLDDAQYFLASHGLEGWMAETRGTPVHWAFCKYAVERKSVFVVEDAPTHPMVARSPLVTDHGIRCYLGAPLITSRGNALGTICVVGDEPREFTKAEERTLSVLSDRAVEHIERRAADPPRPGPAPG